MPRVSPKRKSNEKWCCGCDKFHLKTSFHKNSKRKDGYTSWCKDCTKKYEIAYPRKKYMTSKSELPWWRQKFARTKLQADYKYFHEQFTKNSNCYYCKTSLQDVDVHIDHRVPKSRGGTDRNENLVLSCENCNRLKNNKTEAEFIDFLKEYMSRFEN